MQTLARPNSASYQNSRELATPTELSLAIRVELEKHGDGEGPSRDNYACGRWNWDTLTLAAKGRSQAGKVRRRRSDATLRGKRHRRPAP